MVKRTAETEYPIHELLRERWSPKAFADKPVETEKLRSLFEAARWAPSSYNTQPWNFIIATKDDPENYQRLLGCLVDANASWAKSAPLLALSVAKMTHNHNGQPNRHAFYDLGQAAANLTMEATALGLAVHQMGGFYPDKARTAFAVPEGYELVSALAIGYPELQCDKVPADLRKLYPRERKPIESFVFSGRWGEPAPAVREEVGARGSRSSAR